MENMFLLLAACLCACCSFLSFISEKFKIPKKVIVILWYFSSILVTTSTLLMISLQLLSRFEYQYVYNHTNKATPIIYKISCLWSGQEGSFLLWAFILSIMGFLVLTMKGKGTNYSFGIYALISFCIIFMCYVTKPFTKMTIVPLDGLGLTEALKDPWMVLHPPLVFISYSAMAVLFSLSTTVSRVRESISTLRILSWLRFSWIFLGAGILSGSIWAYHALGWGCFWSWDPIENMSLVPWLILCGYLHRKENLNQTVCIVPFSIACFGVFLARSGILKDESLHAYAVGNVIISSVIILFILGAIIYLFVIKLRNLNTKNKTKVQWNTFKKKLTIYSMNLYAFLIFAGTVMPLFLHIEMPIKYYCYISIGFTLIYCILLLLQDMESLIKHNILMIGISTIFLIGVISLTGCFKYNYLLFIWICMMPISLGLVDGLHSKRILHNISHLGLLLLIIGAFCSSLLSNESYVVSKADSNCIEIDGTSIPLEQLSKKESYVLSQRTKDIILNYQDKFTLSGGDIYIPYETKPLISLFWIGGFLILMQPLFILVMKHRQRHHSLN